MNYSLQYIFKDTGFNKPFFSTYLKTSLFSIYLCGFIVWPPWRRHCTYSTTQSNRSYSRLNGEEGGEGDGEDDNRLVRLPSLFLIAIYFFTFLTMIDNR